VAMSFTEQLTINEELKRVVHQEDVWETGDMVPRIINLSARWI
jgi:hypothetical protein